MNLKKQLFLLLLLAVSLLAFLLYFSLKTTILPSLQKQKDIYLDKLSNKMKVSLAIENRYIALLADDWAVWESMAGYVAKPTEAFEAAAFPDDIFTTGSLSLALVMRPDREMVFYRGYKPGIGDIEYGHLSIDAGIAEIHRLVNADPGEIGQVINSAFGPLMIAADLIRKDFFQTEVSGVLVLGRFVDHGLAEKMSTYLQERVEMVLFTEGGRFREYLKRMQGKEQHYQEEQDNLEGYYLVKDMFGKPSFILRIVSDNKIFQVVTRHTLIFMISITSVIFLLGVILYFVLDRGIVKRVRRISDTMGQIEGLKYLSLRVEKDARRDEISSLILNINEMLDKLENEIIKSESVREMLIKNEKLATIGTLSSGIAHEIHNPLLAVANCLQVIKKICRSKSKAYREAIEISESEIERIKGIVSSLLHFFRLGRGEFTRVDLKAILLETIEIVKWGKKLEAAHITARLGERCLIWGSPGRLKQVFVNFIVNSTEAVAARGGELRVELLPAEDGDFVEVHFWDNGRGIPSGIKDKLFEPFISSRESSGIGLGLYVSHGIVKDHKGEIIYDESYRGGTHFLVRFPAGKEGDAHRDIPSPAAGGMV